MSEQANEKTPLRRHGSFYVLTASSVGDVTEQGRTLKQTSRRITATEHSLVKCAQVLPRKPPLPEYKKLCPELQAVIDHRLRQARQTGDPAPVMIAFTVLGGRDYANVINPQQFETQAEYQLQRKQQGEGAQAISQDQLMVDMEECRAEYRGVCTVLQYLAQMEWAMHPVIRREQYKVKNANADGLLQLWRAPFIRGYYYKILVDFGQS